MREKSQVIQYELTEHARIALEKRAILIEWVERALAHPQKVESDTVDADLEHRLIRIVEFDERVLRVIVNIKSETPRIVTAFFDRRKSIL